MAGLDPTASASSRFGPTGELERPVDVAVLAVLAAATAYEAGVALGWLEVGPALGQAPPGDGLMLAAAVFALVAGTCLVHRLRRASEAPCGCVGVAACAGRRGVRSGTLLYVRPYYAPTLRRISDDGLVADAWVYTLVGLAVLAGALVRIRPRLGLSATAFVLMLSAVTRARRRPRTPEASCRPRRWVGLSWVNTGASVS